MRVLLSAYAFSPVRGSEPGLGWRWATELARDHDVTVLTTPFLRDEIEPALQQDGRRLHVEYVPCRFTPAATMRRRLVDWANCYDWQKRALATARVLHAQTPLDLAHHVTYNTWRVPCFLWKLGIPLIWGPVGGGQTLPPGFLRVLGWRGGAGELVRGVFQILSRYDANVRATLRNAAVVVAANSDTAGLLRRMGRNEVDVLLETGLDPAGAPLPLPAASEGLRLLWVGHMEPRKALGLLLEALARVERPERFHLDVVGHGPELARWRAQSERLGLGSQVAFLGPRPKAEVQSLYTQTDAVVFTSLRDTSGNVVLEAFAAARPVVCFAWSGPGDLSDDTCALRVATESPTQAVRDLAAGLERLADDPALRQRLAEAGRRRLEENYTWVARHPAIQALYSKALARGGIGTVR